jgi:hypothetical protein
MHPLIRYFIIPAIIGSLTGFFIAVFHLTLPASLMIACVAAGIAGFVAAGRRAGAAI